MLPRGETFYGQSDIVFYRTNATPQSVDRIPESELSGKDNRIVGMKLWATAIGPEYQRCYTHGDNSILVPTQSFGNFIAKNSASYTGSTMEGCVDYLARLFLCRYKQMTQTVA